MNRQITEKELKIAAGQINLKFGVLELLIAQVRKNQSKYDKDIFVNKKNGYYDREKNEPNISGT